MDAGLPARSTQICCRCEFACIPGTESSGGPQGLATPDYNEPMKGELLGLIGDSLSIWAKSSRRAAVFVDAAGLPSTRSPATRQRWTTKTAEHGVRSKTRQSHRGVLYDARKDYEDLRRRARIFMKKEP